MIIPTQTEFYQARVFKRKENQIDWEEAPSLTFYCRPANNMEKKLFRVQQGVHGTEESVFVYASNLPKDIQINDRIEFLGQIKVVQSIGYYFDDNLIVNANAFNPDYIIENSPKGILLG